MALIDTYSNDSNITGTEKLLGSDADGSTANFLISAIKAYVNLTGAEIKALYEAESDTNAYTDADAATVAAFTGIYLHKEYLLFKNGGLSNTASTPEVGDALVGLGDGTFQNGWFIIAEVTNATATLDAHIDVKISFAWINT